MQTTAAGKSLQSLALSRPNRANRPFVTQCQFCGAQGMTTVSKKMSMMGWIAVVGLFFFFGYFLLCLLPFCLDACKVFNHTCTNCQRVIAKKGD